MKKFIIPVLGLMVIATAANAQTTTPAKTKTHKAAPAKMKTDSTKTTTTVHHTAKKTAPKKTSK